MSSVKLKALATAELVRPMLEPLARKTDFEFAGYALDHVLIPSTDAYRFREIYECFDPENPCGHPAVQLPPSARGRNVFRDGEVFKVTHPSDVEIAELMMRQRTPVDFPSTLC